MVTEDRYTRQRDIIPPDRLASCRATVIGVGAIGRQVALQLTAIGMPWLQVIDFDIVESVNLATQGYLESDLGRAKVDATAAMCRRVAGSQPIELLAVNGRFKRSMDIGNAIFCCVDKIDTRRMIFETTRGCFFVDGRMSAETLRILTVLPDADGERYRQTLFPAAEAYTGGCTAKATIYCANIAAGMMLSQFTKWLRRMPVDSDVSLNLLSMELSA